MEREEYNRIEQAAELLKALGHPVRLCIVKKLLEGGCCNVASMERCVDVTQSSVSQHLARLRAAGVVQGRRQGNEVFYEVTDPKVRAILSVLLEEEP